MTQLGRLLTAMVTPFKESGEVDYEEAQRLAHERDRKLEEIQRRMDERLRHLDDLRKK